MAYRRTKEFEDFVRNYQPRLLEIIPVPTYEIPTFDGEEETEEINPSEPQKLEDFVGQEQAKTVVKIIVDSANKEKRLIPNVLLVGAYGHGKTTLAKLIAKRHRKKAQIIDGSVAGVLIKPNPDKIYIVDEAHNIPAQVTDSFNILIDAGRLRIIGCTTNPGALSAPFRSRFRTIYLTDYEPQDIEKILLKAAQRLAIKVEKKALKVIANRSKCNPRAALTTLDFVREIASINNQTSISYKLSEDALNKLGIDKEGLTTLDRKYLDILKQDHPVGLQYISSVLSLDGETIQEEIEPYLLRKGLIERTVRGRIRTDRPQQAATNNLEDMLRRAFE